jgi:hypothetical protein
VSGEFKPASIYFDNTRRYILECSENKQEIIQITYFDANATDSKEDYFEVYLNKNFESLLWKSYSNKIKNTSEKKKHKRT